MTAALKTRLINIGNPQGIRMPNLLLTQHGFVDEVTLDAHDDALVIRPHAAPREKWDEQFRAMATAGDDQLLDAEPLAVTEWGSSEWEWL